MVTSIVRRRATGQQKHRRQGQPTDAELPPPNHHEQILPALNASNKPSTVVNRGLAFGHDVWPPGTNMSRDAWLKSLRVAGNDASAVERVLADGAPADGLQHAGQAVLRCAPSSVLILSAEVGRCAVASPMVGRF